MPVMQTSDLTPRQYWEEVKANPNRAKFGFGEKAAIINIDCQRAYTDIDNFKTAYQTDPQQLQYINELSALARSKNMPVIWTYVAYMDNADDAGVWGTRTNTPDSLQNIKVGDERAELDPRLEIDHTRDAIINKRMASVFHETLIPSTLRQSLRHHAEVCGCRTGGCRETVADGTPGLRARPPGARLFVLTGTQGARHVRRGRKRRPGSLRLLAL